MRQVLSTALVAVIVGALAGVTAGTFAQAEPGAAAPAAKVVNADRVDGKHAVAYTNKRGVRAGKLVATNARGLLPSNIVQPYWGYIKNKPGILADHDTEFLHDFRVACRRTRSALTQLKGILPASVAAPFNAEFKWPGWPAMRCPGMSLIFHWRLSPIVPILRAFSTYPTISWPKLIHATTAS